MVSKGNPIIRSRVKRHSSLFYAPSQSRNDRTLMVSCDQIPTCVPIFKASHIILTFKTPKGGIFQPVVASGVGSLLLFIPGVGLQAALNSSAKEETSCTILPASNCPLLKTTSLRFSQNPLKSEAQTH